MILIAYLMHFTFGAIGPLTFYHCCCTPFYRIPLVKKVVKYVSSLFLFCLCYCLNLVCYCISYGNIVAKPIDKE